MRVVFNILHVGSIQIHTLKISAVVEFCKDNVFFPIISILIEVLMLSLMQSLFAVFLLLLSLGSIE